MTLPENPTLSLQVYLHSHKGKKKEITIFAKSLHFHLKFKGFANKISHMLYTNK